MCVSGGVLTALRHGMLVFMHHAVWCQRIVWLTHPKQVCPDGVLGQLEYHEETLVWAGGAVVHFGGAADMREAHKKQFMTVKAQ